MMPIGDPQAKFIYPTLTLMMDSFLYHQSMVLNDLTQKTDCFLQIPENTNFVTKKYENSQPAKKKKVNAK